MDRLSGLEERVRSHISGNIDVKTEDIAEDGPEAPMREPSCDKSVVFHVGDQFLVDGVEGDQIFLPEAVNGGGETIYSGEGPIGGGGEGAKGSGGEGAVDDGVAAVPLARPPYLRKLSEVLPQFPDPNLQDSTHLPDRVVRLWAAELAQVRLQFRLFC